MTTAEVALTCEAIVVGIILVAGFAMLIWNGLASEYETRQELRELARARREKKERGVHESETAPCGISMEESTSLAGKSSEVEGKPSHTPEEDKKITVDAGEATLPISVLLFVCSLAIAGYGAYRFVDGHPYTGLKFVGFSITVLGGCFDPINYLWLLLPFTFSHIVKSPRYARLTFPVMIIGWVLIIIGWVGDGWLVHPPVANPTPMPGSP